MTKKTEMNTIEQYSQWMFQELKDYGYLIDFIREPETIRCANKVKWPYLERLKTKANRLAELVLFPDVNYTYDYKLIWAPKAEFLFYELVNKYAGIKEKGFYFEYKKPMFIAQEIIYKGALQTITRLDVKSAIGNQFGNSQTSVTFPIKQRMIWDEHGIYIQKFVPIPMSGVGKTIAMFPNYFTPKRYMFTDAEGSTRLRKIRWAITDINGYIVKAQEKISQLNLFN